MLKEFKNFAMRGNVIDMAIGIIIGSAFGAIIKSLVSDLLMPPLGLLFGDVNFSDLFIILKQGSSPAPYQTLALAQEAGAVTLNYGIFINTLISFLVIAFAMFLLIRSINRLQKEEQAPPAEPTTKDCPYCTTTIPINATRCPHCTSEI